MSHALSLRLARLPPDRQVRELASAVHTAQARGDSGEVDALGALARALGVADKLAALFPDSFNSLGAEPTKTLKPAGRVLRRAAEGELAPVITTRAAQLTPDLKRFVESSNAEVWHFDPFARDKTFSAATEFPPFLSALPSAPEADVEAKKQLLGLALQGVLQRVVVPVADGAGGFRQARYFDLLPKELKDLAEGGTSRLFVSGGVVRAALAFLYRQALAGMQQVPPVSPEKTLLRLATDAQDIPVSDVRGVNSDWDVLVDAPADKIGQLKMQVLAATNSAFDAAGGHAIALDGQMERNVFVVGDVKSYGTQLELTCAQGGSTLDWLGFDVARGEFVEPQGHEGIIDRLVRHGTWRFEDAKDPARQKDPADTALRGARPFLELPFARLEDEAPLRKGLERVLREMDKLPPSKRAAGQFTKATSNSIEGGAHNRLLRAAPGSIDALLCEVGRATEARTKYATLRELVDLAPLSTTHGRELNGLPASLLLSTGDFIQRHTDGGVVYHGTPSIEAALALARGGMYVSSGQQGRAIFGRGGYTTPDNTVAAGYAGDTGIVFHLKVRTDKKLNVLDWPKVEKQPFMKALVAKSKDLDEVFETLARDHGVDVIVNKYVLVQNAAALRFPENAVEMIEAYVSMIENPSTPPLARLNALALYESLFAYAKGMGGGARLRDPASYVPALNDIVEQAVSMRGVDLDDDDAATSAYNLAELVRARALEIYPSFFQAARAAGDVIESPLAFARRLLEPLLRGSDNMASEGAARDYLHRWFTSPDDASRAGAPSPLSLVDVAVRHFDPTSAIHQKQLLPLLAELFDTGRLQGESPWACLPQVEQKMLTIKDGRSAAVWYDAWRDLCAGAAAAGTPAPPPAKAMAWLFSVANTSADILDDGRARVYARYVEAWSGSTDAVRKTPPHPGEALVRLRERAESGASFAGHALDAYRRGLQVSQGTAWVRGMPTAEEVGARSLFSTLLRPDSERLQVLDRLQEQIAQPTVKPDFDVSALPWDDVLAALAKGGQSLLDGGLRDAERDERGHTALRAHARLYGTAVTCGVVPSGTGPAERALSAAITQASAWLTTLATQPPDHPRAAADLVADIACGDPRGAGAHKDALAALLKQAETLAVRPDIAPAVRLMAAEAHVAVARAARAVGLPVAGDPQAGLDAALRVVISTPGEDPADPTSGRALWLLSRVLTPRPFHDVLLLMENATPEASAAIVNGVFLYPMQRRDTRHAELRGTAMDPKASPAERAAAAAVTIAIGGPIAAAPASHSALVGQLTAALRRPAQDPAHRALTTIARGIGRFVDSGAADARLRLTDALLGIATGDDRVAARAAFLMLGSLQPTPAVHRLVMQATHGTHPFVPAAGAWALFGSRAWKGVPIKDPEAILLLGRHLSHGREPAAGKADALLRTAIDLDEAGLRATLPLADDPAVAPAWLAGLGANTWFAPRARRALQPKLDALEAKTDGGGRLTAAEEALRLGILGLGA